MSGSRHYKFGNSRQEPAPSHRRLHAFQRGDEVAEAGAADFEIAVLVERGAGRRQQHDGVGEAGSLGIARGAGDGDFEGFGDLVRYAVAERAGKFRAASPIR